jgi:GT2 family glycosyltransferase
MPSSGKQDNQKTLIIILNFNKSLETMNCIESMAGLHGEYDIMVIDNGSKNKIRSELINMMKKRFNITELTGETRGCEYRDYAKSHDRNIFFMTLDANTGYARGNNYGARFSYAAGYVFSLVSNNDIKVSDAEVLDQLESAMNTDKTIAWCAPKIIAKNGNQEGPFPEIHLSELIFKKGILLPFWIIFMRHEENEKNALLLKSYNNLVSTPHIFVGSFSLFRSSSLDSVGYFDEQTFLYTEEQIISERLRKHGYKMQFVPDSTVLHNHDYSNDGINYRLELIFLKSRIYYYRKYKNKNKFIVLAAAASRIVWLVCYKPIIVIAKKTIHLAIKKKLYRTPKN